MSISALATWHTDDRGEAKDGEQQHVITRTQEIVFRADSHTPPPPPPVTYHHMSMTNTVLTAISHLVPDGKWHTVVPQTSGHNQPPTKKTKH